VPRVVLVGNCPLPWGGVSRHLADLALLLEDARLDYRVVDLEPAHRQDGRVSGITAARVEVPDSRAGLLMALARAAGPGTLMHVHTNGHNRNSWLVALLAGGLARARGARTLLTLHSGLCPGYLRGGAGPAGTAVRWMARAAAAAYDRIVCVNSEIAAAVRDTGVPPAQLRVVAAFSPRHLQAMLRRGGRPRVVALGDDPGVRWIGAALAHGREYGADVFFAAMGKVARQAGTEKVRFVAMGPGTQEPWMQELARQAGVLDRTAMLGEVPHAEAVAVMQRLSVFVRPSRADGDSVSVREALALGTPAVVTAVGHRPFGVVQVPREDPDALARAVVQVLARPPSRAPAPPDSLPALLALYRELLGPSSAPAHPAARPLATAGRAH
jgi:glycosyltransferase involved in cell wall biosynthesis